MHEHRCLPLAPGSRLTPGALRKEAAQHSAPALLGHRGLHSRWALRGHCGTEWSPSIAMAQRIPTGTCSTTNHTGRGLAWVCPLLCNLVVPKGSHSLTAGDIECAAHSMGPGSPLLSHRMKLPAICFITDLLSPLHFDIKD